MVVREIPSALAAALTVGGCDNVCLEGRCRGAANAGDLPFLQCPQQPALQGQQHVANFVEQQDTVPG
ncbi:UDP-N-acetylglucosamine diphosphorylase/glucosamine-1-phosphate N-acetyltransferase [Pseudomonas monteilii]|uniref:UDP-N-acetylglucosamine diphosphorylase/glucosamine-1-phosphate N-acetyltransferase n=1 Tax=Pseudomonas monteilii TaxID=76759 RepID=A0AAE6RCZ6_9PSED|nr:UDP-N-acetylglucosamine diphosphorylase/glucosamine-1-phosphate N-acetyltransferase [Pseudomonas monteilii]